LFDETTSAQAKERMASHIVNHDNIDGITQHREFDDLGHAVAFVEELRNIADVEDAKRYALGAVAFEMKPYFKVEVLDAVMPLAPEAVTPSSASSESVETWGRDRILSQGSRRWRWSRCRL
jgi:hypothetical protein